MGLKLVTIFIFLQVARIESVMQVSGYVGANVILPSYADPSWNLTKIEWSIFPNNTWIATYRSGAKSIERFYRYKGRLSLDTVSGNLTIYNLREDDAMEYSVDLVNTKEKSKANKIKLEVRHHLKKPVIRDAAHTTMEGGCLLQLNCSSADQDVNLTWKPNATDLHLFPGESHSSSAVLFVFLNSTQNNVEFTCTSKTNTDNASSTVMPKCNDAKPLPTCPSPPSPRSRDISFFIFGFSTGVFLTLLVMCLCGDKIRTVWQYVMAR